MGLGSGVEIHASKSLKYNRRRYEPKYFKKAQGRYDKEPTVDEKMKYVLGHSEMTPENKEKLHRKLQIKKIVRIVIDVLFVLVPLAIAIWFLLNH